MDKIRIDALLALSHKDLVRFALFCAYQIEDRWNKYDKKSTLQKIKVQNRVIKLKQKAIKEMKVKALKGKFTYKLVLDHQDDGFASFFIADEFRKMEEFKDIKIDIGYSLGEISHRAIDFSWENESKYVDNVFEDIVLRNKI